VGVVVQDKHVLVVGAGKTGTDIMAEVVAASTAKSVTMLYRQVGAVLRYCNK
jgi:cation diffusion facilitator CzcD-associated flavoprotein CzcO